jgi:hypothetical protein
MGGLTHTPPLAAAAAAAAMAAAMAAAPAGIIRNSVQGKKHRARIRRMRRINADQHGGEYPPDQRHPRSIWMSELCKKHRRQRCLSSS